MEKQMKIYSRAVPVSSERHKGWSIAASDDYTFAKDLNVVPVLTTEFAKAALEYPIIFSKTNGSIIPGAVLGLRASENLYLTAEGKWNANYIPAFVRRYPFIFSHNSEKGTFTLCIDEDFSGFNQDGKGSLLFDEEGEPSEYLRHMLAFARSYQREFELTRRFCERLGSLDILKAGVVEFHNSGERSVTNRGFLMIDRERFQSVPTKKLPELFVSGDLEHMYCQLLSMENLNKIGSLFNLRISSN